MSYEDMQSALAGRSGVIPGNPAGADQIAEAEARIGPLPEDYRRYLADYGWLTVRHYEIYGLGPDVPMPLDVVRMTLDERADYGLPARLVAILNDGGGNLACFDTEADDGAVVWWDHEGGDPSQLRRAAASFSDWVMTLIGS